MDFLDYEIFRLNEYSLTVMHLVYILLIYLGARVFIWSSHKALQHNSKYNKLDKGSRYARTPSGKSFATSSGQSLLF